MTTSTAPDVRSPRKRRGLRATIWIVVALAVLVGLYFAADAITRPIAQDAVTSEIQKQLPANVTAPDLKVRIGGFSIIWQYLTGSFDRVQLDASHLNIDGVPARAQIVAKGIPTDFSKPVGHVAGAMIVDQSALNRLIDLPGEQKLTLGTNTVGVMGTSKLLGVDVNYAATVVPSVSKDGRTVTLTPQKVTIGTSAGKIDATGFAKTLLGAATVPICVAQYLPDGVTVSDLTVSKNSAYVSVQARDIVLDEKTFESKGNCS